MSISITINNINDLSDAERAVLRLIAGNEASVADTLKQTVRSMVVQPAQDPMGGGDEGGALAKFVKDDMAQGLRKSDDAQDYLAGTGAQPAPAPTVPAPPVAPTSAELDAAGLPWDKRIHSSSRAKVADGTWRYARNLDKALIATVEAELRAVQAIPVPVAPAPTDDGSLTGDFMRHEQASPTGWPFGTVELPSTDAALLEATRHETEGVAYGVAVPVVPLPPVAPPAPSALPMTFAQLMQHVTPLLVSGKLTQPVLQGVVEKCGLPHLAALGARPDLVETVKAAIDEVVGGVQ